MFYIPFNSQATLQYTKSLQLAAPLPASDLSTSPTSGHGANAVLLKGLVGNHKGHRTTQTSLSLQR